jgi:DNA-binding XRE family transcriptional regulator
VFQTPWYVPPITYVTTMEDVEDWVRARAKLPPPPVRRALREGAGVKQEDVANVIGVTRETVSRWESGERGVHRRHVVAYVELLEFLRRTAG